MTLTNLHPHTEIHSHTQQQQQQQKRIPHSPTKRPPVSHHYSPPSLPRTGSPFLNNSIMTKTKDSNLPSHQDNILLSLSLSLVILPLSPFTPCFLSYFSTCPPVYLLSSFCLWPSTVPSFLPPLSVFVSFIPTSLYILCPSHLFSSSLSQRSGLVSLFLPLLFYFLFLINIPSLMRSVPITYN